MKFLNSYVTFTPTEWEIVEDRLIGAPDAIAEALDIERSVVESITVHDRTMLKIILHVPQEARAALADALDGSTYLAKCADAVEFGDMPPAKLRALKRAAKTAVDKVRAAGIECDEVPFT
jgi:hypothetical protein